MHNVSMFVRAGTPIDGLAQSKEWIVDEPEIPAMHGGDASNDGGGADNGGEEGDEYGNGA